MPKIGSEDEKIGLRNTCLNAVNTVSISTNSKRVGMMHKHVWNVCISLRPMGRCRELNQTAYSETIFMGPASLVRRVD